MNNRLHNKFFLTRFFGLKPLKYLRCFLYTTRHNNSPNRLKISPSDGAVNIFASAIRFRIHSQTDAGRTAAGYVDKQVARVRRSTSRSDDPHTHYRKTEKNRALHGDTSTLGTASSTQLTAQQYTEYNTGRTHFTVMFFSND